MVQNRFFKTTTGVDFDLVVGFTPKSAADHATQALFITDGAVGDYAAFADAGNGDSPATLTWNTALTAAEKKQRIVIGALTAAGTLTAPVGFIGGSVTAVNTPYAAPALQDCRIVKASGTVLATQEVVFKVVETTPLSNFLPVFSYTEKVVTNLAAAITKLVAQVNAAKNGEFFTAAAVTDGIRIVSTDSNRHFRLAIDVIGSRTAPLNDTAWTYTVTTKAYAGSGTLAQVKALEEENWAKRGIGHLYPQAGTTAKEFGLPVSMVDLAVANGDTTFDVVTIVGYKTDVSPAAGQTARKCTLFVVVPAGEGDEVAATFA